MSWQLVPIAFDDQDDASESDGIDDGNVEAGKIACGSEPGVVKLREGREARDMARVADVARITLLERAGAL